MSREDGHLTDGDLVETYQPLSRQQMHVQELGIETLDISQNEKLLDGGVVAHVAIEFGIGIAPLPRRLAEKGHVQEISLASVGEGGLNGRDLGRNKMLPDRISM